MMIRIALSFCFFAFSWVGLAQSPLLIETPPERFVSPGEFATFVFRVTVQEAMTVQAEASSQQGWDILRQPGELELSPDKRQPIAVTVAIPENAEAFSQDVLSLELRGKGMRETAHLSLSVSEAHDLVLESPRETLLTPEGVLVKIINRGNVKEDALLELRRTGNLVEARELSLEPYSEREESFLLGEDGNYTLTLQTEEGLEVTKTLSVIRFGVPEPDPFLQGGEATASLSTDGTWETELSVAGALSDFSTFGARLSAPDWRDSFAEINVEHAYAAPKRTSPMPIGMTSWGLRLGQTYRSPYRLKFPTDFGVAGRYTQTPWTVALSAGWVEENRFSGYALSNYSDEILFASAGLGVRSGRVLGGVHSTFDYGKTLIQTNVLHRDGVLNATLDASGEDLLQGVDAHRSVVLALNNLFTPGATLSAEASYQPENLDIFADISLPLTADALFDLNIGVSDLIPSELLGQLSYGVQAGYLSSFANLRYYTELSEGWRATHEGGVILDNNGFGLSAESYWSQSGVDFLSADAQFSYYPNASLVKGRLGARAQATFDTVQLSANGSWNLNEQTLGLSADSVWRDGPWRLEATAMANYNYASARPWSLIASVSGNYDFSLNVAEPLTTFFGGRRVGKLSGSLRAGDAPIEGVEVSVGRYRFITDERGEFAADLPPDTYEVHIDTATLPITYRLNASEASIDVTLRGTTSVHFEAVETAALSGRVLQDSDANGEADTPQLGVRASLFLSDAEGFRRTLVTNEDGSFEVRGLVPGEVNLSLSNLPLGSKAVGSAVQTLSLASGLVTETLFLVQPARSTGKSFAAGRLRIRDVIPEVERLRAGLSPLVTVNISGEADSVVLETALDTINLEFNGSTWQGRLPLPADLDAGIFNFNAIARQGETETRRQGRIIIDPEAEPFKLELTNPVRVNEPLQVSLYPYFIPDAVSLKHPFGNDITLNEDPTTAGVWIATVQIPADAEDKTYTLTVSATHLDGTKFEQETTFRVLNP